ncbi:hypothetical protein [Methanolobus sp. WCC4]|uniref:hypothetical protein n=1 Tax=Methanolobus sp. WCC4 TaxID=3125784 RepID=UPI0030FC3C54
MCMIEEVGYSEENKKLYCTKCVIHVRTGKCEYLKYLESKVSVDLSREYLQEILIHECGL